MGSKGEKEVFALFDSVAAYSCIRPDLARQIERAVAIPGAMTFKTAKKGERLTAKERVSINFYLEGSRFSDEFMIIPGLSEEVIIGSAILQMANET